MKHEAGLGGAPPSGGGGLRQIGVRCRLGLNRTTIAIFLLVLTVLSAGAAKARADGPPASAADRQLRIERSLACPQCTGLPVDVCDRDICQDMRAVIQQKIAAGESDAAIERYFVDRYGQRVLLAPPRNGANLVAWLMPLAGLLAGGMFVYLFLRYARHGSRAPATDPASDPTLSSYRLSVERELEQYE